MTLRWLMASLHLLALPLGLGAIWARSRALLSIRPDQNLRRVFIADNLWGAAAALWIATGLLRAFVGLEKGTDYYLKSRVFYIKMALLLIVLLLEIWPMATLIGWRIRLRRGNSVNLGVAASLARVSQIQALLVIAMVFAATALARGLFY